MIKRNIAKVGVAVLGLAVGTCFLTGSNEASARGCNGVVDQFKWGCAAWDNNNGPQYPHYKKPAKTTAPAKVRAPATPAQRPTIQHNQGNGIISRDGAGIIGNDAGSLIGPDGATMRRR